MSDEDIGSYWPHKFTKNGKQTQIGEELLMGHTKVPTYAQPMICVYCMAEFMQGRESPPPGPCPARNTKTELKRLRS